jgi:hypothetical protein
MRNLQDGKLFHDAQQEKAQRKIRSQEALQSLQEAYVAQRDEVTLRFAGVV